jgi:hypothetical protein
MSKLQFEQIWIEQCEAAGRVKENFGLASALDYLIGEKLLTFTEVASDEDIRMPSRDDLVRETSTRCRMEISE